MKEVKINNNTYLIEDNLIVKNTVEVLDSLPFKPEPFTLVLKNNTKEIYYFNGSVYNLVKFKIKQEAEQKEETKIIEKNKK